MSRRSTIWLSVSLLGLLSLASTLFGQRASQGVITGLVTDASGAAVPEATVTIVDEIRGFKTVVGTSADGNYGTPPMATGTYTVHVEKQGFKTFEQKGIILLSGATYRQDVVLQVGVVTQTVEVTAASAMISTENAEVSHSINQKYYQDLPVVMGTDIRLAESLLVTQPGYTPMEPNGDPMFRGSAFNSRINGGQTMSTENFIDGAAFGYTNGHNETHESSPPYEAISEMTLTTGSFSAQYGHTSGGFITYTTKSGTNQLHGSIYEYYGSRALNTRGFFVPDRVPYMNSSYGLTIGGPVVIPKVYNGRNKTFFFFNMDFTNLRTGVGTGPGLTVATDLMHQGNFSEVLDKTTQEGVDALGRPIYLGEIYNPASLRNVTAGQVDPATGIVATATGPVRDPYPGNIIPTNDPLLSGVGARVMAVQAPAALPGFRNNAYGTDYGDPNGRLDPKTYMFRIDHAFTENFKTSVTYTWNNRPAIRNCNGPQQCNTQFNGETESDKNTLYSGPGFFQRISVDLYHQQFDWVIKPNVFNHTTIAFDRWVMNAHGLSDGVGWIPNLGLKDSNGNYINPAIGTGGAYPNMSFNGYFNYAADGNGWYRNGEDITNRWQFLDDVTWIKGKHTIKVGGEYRHHQIPQKGWNRNVTGTWNFSNAETAAIDNTGTIVTGSTGNPMASVLLGQVDNANYTIFEPGTWYEAYSAVFVNDEFKVTPKLTLTLGLRWDYMSPRTEAYNRYSSFDPAATNPASPGVLGAMTFAGTGTGRTGSNTFEDPAKNDWGPRLGFAYRLTDKDVIRGGYGMYYSGISFNYSAPGGYPDVGASATYPTANNLSGGLVPAFYWDVGSSCPMASLGVGCGFPAQYIVNPPDINPAVSIGGAARGVRPDSLNLPRYQNYSLTYERQLTPNTRFSIGYIGNHGTRLPMNGNGLGLLSNMSNPSVLALGTDSLQAPLNSATAQALPVVQAMPVDPGTGLHAPFPGYSVVYPRGTSVAQALRPFPQYTGVTWRSGFPGGYSIFNSLQTQVEKRFSNGLQFRVAYTWSKLINNGAENGLIWNAPVQNPINASFQRGLSADDVPHSLIVAYTYQLPFGKGKRFADTDNGVVNALVGGWNFGAVQTYHSGRPLSITMANNLGGLLFTPLKSPNKVGGGGWTGGHFDPGKDFYLNPSGWSNPGDLNFGNAGRTDPNLRDFAVYNEDFNLYKEFNITKEALKLRFESQFGNAFNRTLFCGQGVGMDTNWSDAQGLSSAGVPSGFGTVRSQCNQPRHIVFGLKLYW